MLKSMDNKKRRRKSVKPVEVEKDHQQSPGELIGESKADQKTGEDSSPKKD